MLFQTSQAPSPDSILSERGFLANFWRQVFIEAKEKKASDIHIESLKTGLQVRLRTKGVLISPFTLITDPNEAIQLIDKIKEICILDLTIKSVLQDTSFSLKLTNATYRVSLSPGFQHGECLVLRVINNEELPRLSQLNLNPTAHRDLIWSLEQSQGLFLVTGPTGSGKSTTLQAAIAEINAAERKIISIENPPERLLKGVVHEAITSRFGWAEAIKGAMRQDPDIILVGEIRDPESAKLAVEAAQTGHLVLSTLHTNDVPQTVNRLMTLGVERYLIADSLLFVSAQRLLRRLCDECKEPVGAYFQRNIYGCNACDRTGYSGRLAILEYAISPDPDLIYNFDARSFAKILRQTLKGETAKYVKQGYLDQRLLEGLD